VAPYDLAGKSSVQIYAEHSGIRSAPFSARVVEAVPGLFSANATGSGPGAIYNQDFTFNTSDNPAARGDLIILFGTGEGQTDPPGIDGLIVGDVLPAPHLQVSLTIGGQAAEIVYAGPIPTQVSGLLQVNARVPAGAPTGIQPVILSVGANRSQTSLTV